MAEFWYDGDNGSDSNPGTEALPFRTLGSSTVDTATGVSTPTNLIIHLKRGTTVQLASSLSCYGSFLADAYGDGDELPILDKQTLGDFNCTVGYSAAATDVQTYRNIRIVDPIGTTSSAGVGCASTNGGRVEVLDCEIDGFNNSVSLPGGEAYKILRNRFTNFRNNGFNTDHVGKASSDIHIADNYIDGRIDGGGVCWNHPIVLHSAVTPGGLRCVIERNICVSGTEAAISVAKDWTGCIIQNNVIWARQDGVSTSWSDIGIEGPSTVCRNNIIFSRYRFGIDVFPLAVDSVIENNIIVSEVASTRALIRVQATSRPTIRHNLLVAASGYSATMITGLNSITTPVNIYNNVLVNYSANASARFIGAQTDANIDNWDIDGNVYVQMPGSQANAWSTGVSWATWRARASSPDVGSIDPLTSLPLQIPSYTSVGEDVPLGGLTPGSAVQGVGVHVSYLRDANRVQRRNPPSAGPYDLPTQRRVLDSDPAGW